MVQQRALVVGVSNYPPSIPSLPGVANDAKAMADLLGSPEGQFRSGVTTLLDAQATGAAIREQLDTALSKGGQDDTVFVYLAGHGTVHNGAYYFVAHDTARGRVAETGVPLADLRAMFDASPSRRVFVWLDFCHSGGVIERDLVGGSQDVQTVIERTLHVVGRGKIIVTACTALQTAKESKALGHGFFTHALLEGLRGAAVDNKGRVLATTLYNHVVDRVQAESHDQSPVWHGQMEGHIILMHYADRKPDPGGLPGPGGGQFCESSGDWILLGNLFLSSVSVTIQANKIVIEVKPRSTAEYAAIQQLAPKHGRGNTIPFAHGDESLLARVSDITSRSTSGQQVVTITLTPENVTFGGHVMEMNVQGHSADEIAEKRAGRLLLNDPPPLPKKGFGVEHFVEMHIKGMSGTHYPAERAVLQEAYAALKGGSDPLLPLARLKLVYAMKASDCVEQVLELRLGPVKDGKCHVRFRGRRARRYTNVEPHVIAVEGDCPLE